MTPGTRFLTYLAKPRTSGLSLGTVGAALTPRLWFYDHWSQFLDNGDVGFTGSTPDGTAIGTWKDASGNATDAAASGVPIFHPSTGVEGGTGISLQFTSGVAFGSTFTAYAVGSRSTGQIWTPVAEVNAIPKGYLGVYSDNNCYCVDGAVNIKVSAVALTGAFLARWRVVSGAVFFAATGVAEVTMTGTNQTGVTFGSLIARPTADYSNSAAPTRAVFVRDSALSSAEDTYLRDRIQATYGVNL